MTFAALKEYDSREADGENEAKEGKPESERQKPRKVPAATPKQLVCNQRQSPPLRLGSGQFDFHLSNEALIFGPPDNGARLN